MNLNFGLDKAVAIANACCAVIGVRSGFMDLMSFSNTAIIAIDTKEYDFADMHRLEDMWTQNNRIQTITYSRNVKSNELVESILNFITKR